MRYLLVAALPLVGCSSVFGLESPIARHDAALDSPRSDAAADAAPDARMLDGAVDAPTLVCPSSYASINGSVSRYRKGTNNTSWTNAQANCLVEGTHLAVIGDETERLAVASILGVGSWIGRSDKITEGTYLWVTDENTGAYPALGTNAWALNEPSAAVPSEDCINENPTGKLFDDDCGTAREFVCECDGYATNSSHY